MDENHAKYKKMIEDTDKRLKGLMAKWVLRYDYFGFLFSLVRRKAVVGLQNPAAIAPTPQGTLELLFNPILIAATPDVDLHEMLHHEGLHILNKHLSRMLRIVSEHPEDQQKKHIKLINIAADCCVNQQGKIKNPLMIAGTPFKLHFPCDHGLEPDRMMEEYYYILLERERQKKKQDSGEKNTEKSENSEDEKSKGNKNDQGDKSDDKSDEKSNGSTSDDSQKNNNNNNQESVKRGTGESNQGNEDENDENGNSLGKNSETDNSDLGNHTHWINDEVADPQALSRKLDTYSQRIIRESAKNYQRTKSRGKMPGYIKELIELALQPPPIPYYEIIRQLVRGSKIGKYKRSLTHVNRKRTYVFQLAKDKVIPMISPFPGRKRDSTFKIGVIIDTSGSQTTDDVMDALAGCASIIEKDRDCETTVLEVDTIIHKEYKLKRVSDIDFDVKGRGGTTLFPGIMRCKELKVDICMCFTDGYTETFNEIDRRLFPKKMLWVITPGGTDEKLNQTGYVVHLPERTN